MKRIIKEDSLYRELIHSSIAVLITFTLGLLFSGLVISEFQHRVPFKIYFIQSSPGDIVISAVKIAAFISIYLSLPYILYNIIDIKLLKPAIKSKESFITYLISAFLLFTMGVFFSWYVFIPASLFFMLGINTNIAYININILSYITFCLQNILITGIIFVLPVIYVFLEKTKLLSFEELFENWKNAAIIAIAVSTLIISQEILAILIFGLLIMSIYFIIAALAKITVK